MKASNLLAFIAGVAAGAAAGILLAPDKGDKTRAKIVALLEEKGISKDKFEDIIGRVKSKINEYTDMSDIEIAIDESLKEEEDSEETK
ncbi:MAG: YtxH domain-containing protein [Paludibacteraceae bacterium]|nr:YtxH domain-containing protein [Paludibacteraceae bacterium]